MFSRTVSVVLAAASDNNVALNQTPGAAGNLTLNGSAVSGGVATLDVARRVLVTTAADESAKTITITGTDRNNRTISEAVTGPVGATAFTNQDFKTITRVAVSAAFTGNVKIGTNAVGSSRWLMVNYDNANFNLGIRVKVTGTVTYSVEKTLDDLMGRYSGGATPVWTDAATPLAIADAYLAGSTVSGETSITNACQAVRLTVTAGTGTAEMVLVEAGEIG